MESILTLKLKQGIQEHQKGKLKEAEILYRNVLHVEPNHPDANHNLGILSASINKTNSAIKLFKTALEVNPKIEQFWISYINALINDQQYENAKKVLKKAKKNGVTKSKLNAIVNELDFKVKNPAPLPSEIQRLINYYQNGSMHDAKKLANSIIEKFPNDLFTWKMLGELLKQEGKIHEAYLANKKAVELNPQDPVSLNNLGICLRDLKKDEEAIEFFKKAIFFKEDFYPAHSNLGITFRSLDKLEEAEVSFRNWVNLEPGNATAYISLGVILYARGDLEAALNIFEKAYSINPKLNESKLCLTLLKARREKLTQEINLDLPMKEKQNNKSTISLYTSNLPVKKDLISCLYKMQTRELDKKPKNDARFGNGICSINYQLFDNKNPIIKNVADDLSLIIKKYFNSEIYIYDSFFNILGAGGGTTPHKHLVELDKDKYLNFSKQKYSLVYYLDVGDQDCEEPGILKLYNPSEDFLPYDGMILIFPANRKHSAVYSGKKDRVMIGINFYTL